MNLYAYTVYDRKALQYHAPFFAVADGAAVRSFMDLANDLQTNVGRHPGDYVLYRCGAYNDLNGELLSVGALVHIADALSLVRQQPTIFDPPARTDAAGVRPEPVMTGAEREANKNGVLI